MSPAPLVATLCVGTGFPTLCVAGPSLDRIRLPWSEAATQSVEIPRSHAERGNEGPMGEAALRKH
jgi:hypothetical protein